MAQNRGICLEYLLNQWKSDEIMTKLKGISSSNIIALVALVVAASAATTAITAQTPAVTLIPDQIVDCSTVVPAKSGGITPDDITRVDCFCGGGNNPSNQTAMNPFLSY